MPCIICKKEDSFDMNLPDNKIISICNECYSSIPSNEMDSNMLLYRKEIETLKTEFSYLMKIAEKSIFTNKNKLPLSVRKQTIKLRKTLKKFRKASLDHEKYINGKNKLDNLSMIKNDIENQ